nr:zinc-ribbon domain-containing protein [Sphingomonas sp.]
MILTCPACATQYRLKDDAIPPQGRQVRCAACKHKWHEDGADTGAGSGAAEPAAADEGMVGHWPPSGGAATTHLADGTGIGPPPPDPAHIEEVVAAVPETEAREHMIAENPEPEVPAQAEVPSYDVDTAPPAEHWPEPSDSFPAQEDSFVAIPAMRYEDEPERKSKLGWIIGLILFVVAAAAAFYFFAPPELKARAGIAEVGESPLEVIVTTRDRQRLASGNELVAISGRVINNTDRLQAIPPIRAELRDEASNKLVYQWTIAPPARSLAPGSAAGFSSTE